MKLQDSKIGMRVRVKKDIQKRNSAYSEDVKQYEDKIYTIASIDLSSYPIYPITLKGVRYCFQPRLLSIAIDTKMLKLKEKLLK